jgi:hypothetical protein
MKSYKPCALFFTQQTNKTKSSKVQEFFVTSLMFLYPNGSERTNPERSIGSFLMKSFSLFASSLPYQPETLPLQGIISLSDG